MSRQRSFIEYLHSDNNGYVFIGTKPERGWHQKPFQTNQVDEMVSYVQELGSQDIYITPGTYLSGESKTASELQNCHVFMADYDCPTDYRGSDNQPYDTVKEAVSEVSRHMAEFGIEPTIVKTGGGIQAFVKLTGDVAQLDDEEFASLAEAFFQCGLSPDKRWHFRNETKDKARFCRLPGTLNTKAGEQAEIHVISSQELSLQELRDRLGDLKPTPKRDQNEALPEEFIQWAESSGLDKFKGEGHYPSSSEKELAIQSYLCRHGITTLEQHQEFFEVHLPADSHFRKITGQRGKEDYLRRGLLKIAESQPSEAPYTWYNPENNRVDVNGMVAWFDQNVLLFLDDFRILNETLRMWDGKKWVVASDKTIEGYFFNYFKQRNIILRLSHLKELRQNFGYYKFDHIEVDGRELDYTKKIAIPFENGTLYIYPESGEHEFREREWNKLDYSLYRITEPYGEDLLTLDWRDSTVGRHLAEFYTEKGAEAYQLYFGSVLIPTFDLQKCLFIYGSGANGKGMITRTITKLFDPGAVTYLNVSKWNKTHENIKLKDCVLNVSSELRKRDLESDAFKSIVACDPITLNPKHETPIEVKPFAKHIFTANDLPNTGVDKALARRFLWVKATKSVPADQQSAKYEVEYSREGVRVWLAIALQGIMKLAELGFKVNTGDQEVALEWMDQNESLYAFVQDVLVEEDQDQFVTTKQICEWLEQWKSANGLEGVIHGMTPQKLGKRLQKVFDAMELECEPGRKRIDGKQERGWFGLAKKSGKPDLVNAMRGTGKQRKKADTESDPFEPLMALVNEGGS